MAITFGLYERLQGQQVVYLQTLPVAFSSGRNGSDCFVREIVKADLTRRCEARTQSMDKPREMEIRHGRWPRRACVVRDAGQLLQEMLILQSPAWSCACHRKSSFHSSALRTRTQKETFPLVHGNATRLGPNHLSAHGKFVCDRDRTRTPGGCRLRPSYSGQLWCVL